MRRTESIRRRLFFLCFILLTFTDKACAEGLFPSLNQMFGTAMPSIGVVLVRTADETGENTDGKYEVYTTFTFDDYYAFGEYLSGVGAVLNKTDETDSAITATLSVRGASMQFVYDWQAQTSTIIYPAGTRPETEKEKVELRVSILPPVGGIMPSLGEALGRYPDNEISNDDGSNTEVYQGVTETDFNTFSVYLSEWGATLVDYQTVGSTFSTSIQFNGETLSFNYDTHNLEATMTYPKGTIEAWFDYAKARYASAVQLLNSGKADEALAVMFSIPEYSRFKPVAEFFAANPELVAAAQLKQYKTVGSYVTFGSYPQTSAGNDNTPIEWLVLDYDAANNRSLIISRYGLDAKAYNTQNNTLFSDLTWETCTLRSWLNGVFLRKAFSAQEQKGIVLTTVDNSQSQGYSIWTTNGENNTQDRIFLLSYAETYKYFGVTSEDSNSIQSRATPTAFALQAGAWTSNSQTTADGSAAGWWWLRSLGVYQLIAAGVDPLGSLSYYNVDTGIGCVRPALWIDLESEIF